MRIFVTGAPGFIGSALVPELIQAGHQVLGLTRSEAGAEKLRGSGAEVLHGNIEDLESLPGSSRLRPGCSPCRPGRRSGPVRLVSSSASVA